MIHEQIKIILKNIAVSVIATFFVLLLLEIFSRNFIKKVPTKFFHFDKNVLIWNQEIGAHAYKKSSGSIMSNGHFKEDIFIDKNGFRTNYPDENITNPIIITIGDSQTFGHGISNNDTWPNLLGKYTRLSVGNMGVWGYGIKNYEYLIKNLVINYKPKYLIYGMTDNDICSNIKINKSDTEYKKFLSRGNQTHFQFLINKPKSYFINFTSLGALIHEVYIKIFYETSFGISLRSSIRPMTSINLNDKCTMPTIKWLKEKALLLKKYDIKFIVISLPNPRRIISLSKGKPQKNYKKSISLINENQNEKLYFFIDPIIELSDYYKKNNFDRKSIILPVDNHYNKYTNIILANLIKKIIDKLE